MYGAPPADTELGDKPRDSGAVVTVGGKSDPGDSCKVGVLGVILGLLIGFIVGHNRCTIAAQRSFDAIPCCEQAAAPAPAPGAAGAVAVAGCPPPPPPAVGGVASPQTARLSMSASHMQYSGTSGNVYASLVGTTGSSDEVLISHGIAPRVPQIVYMPVVEAQLGVPTALNLRLEGNDGVNLGEIILEVGDFTFEWPEPLCKYYKQKYFLLNMMEFVLTEVFP